MSSIETLINMAEFERLKELSKCPDCKKHIDEPEKFDYYYNTCNRMMGKTYCWNCKQDITISLAGKWIDIYFNSKWRFLVI